MEKENCIRRTLGIETVSEPTGFYPYRVDYDMITMIGAPSSTEFVYLSGPDLDLPDGWYPDYIGTGMFRSCADLQGVIVPGYIAGLSTNAFNGAKNNRFYIYFESGTPMELMGWSKEEPFRFGDDESKIQIMVAFDAENDYINAWMYPMAGYANLDEMLADIRAELSVDGKEPTDLEVYEETGKRLLAVENRLRAMMDLDPISDASELVGELPGLLETSKTAEENGGADSAVSGSEEPDQTPETDDDGADSDDTAVPDDSTDTTDTTDTTDAIEETPESEEKTESASESGSAETETEAETAVQSEPESADEEEVQE